MVWRPGHHSFILLLFVSGLILAGLPTPAHSQENSSPPPSNTTPVTVDQLADRLRAMEEANKKLDEKLKQTSLEYDQRIRQMLDRMGSTTVSPAGAPTDPGGNSSTPGPERTGQKTPVPDYTENLFTPFNPPSGFYDPDSERNQRPALRGIFGPGFQLRSDDGEYSLRIHIQSQVESRVWGRSDQDPVTDGIYLPRQRIFFNGNVTRYIEYVWSINRGLGDLGLLDTYINFHFDDRFQFRIGRFWTPLCYDQFAFPNLWLLTPERSLFTANLSLNRQVGAMGWGFLFDERLDYAVGIFNGPRNSFEDFNNAKDFVGYVNVRPFQQVESLPLLRFLNLGTSLGVGQQDQLTTPLAMRIGAGAANSDQNARAAVPFLEFYPDVFEQGNRVLGSVHMAYFYKSLSLMGEWQYGHKHYRRMIPESRPVNVPVSGYYVAAGYFLTGEEMTKRALVEPLRPFFPRQKGGSFGPGAWEFVARVSNLTLGEQVFSGGLADPNLWANSAITTELGFNWYMNEFMKVYTFWLHGNFDDPVRYRPGGLQKGTDMFWLRAQMYF